MAEHDDLFDALMDLASGSDDLFLDDSNRSDWMRAPFGMPGGKSQCLKHLIPEINRRLPFNGRWVDVFGGTGVVSWNVKECTTMVFNDRYSAIVDFYAQIRDNRETLVEYLHQFPPHSRQQFYASKKIWCTETDPMKRAAHWYYTMRLSVLGKGDCFGRGKGSRFIPLPKSLELFERISYICRDFTLENLDFKLLMKDFDAIDAVFYCDPPYLDTDPGLYEGSWSEDDLRDLLRLIGELKGCVILSHYPNRLIEAQDCWDCRLEWQVKATSDVQVSDSKNNKKQGKGIDNVTEVMWIKEAHV